MAVRNILILSIIIFPITLQLDHTCTFLIPLDDPLEYKVNIGGFKTYKYLKFYDSRLTDPFKDLRYVIDGYGRFQNYTIENGTNIKITVTDVTENNVSGTRTIDEKVTIKEEWMDLFIRPMTNNISLLAESFSESNSFEVKYNQIIEQVDESSFNSEGTEYNLNRSRTSIWEKSGWVNYLLIRVYDTENVYYEMEVVKQPSQGENLKSNEITGILMLSFISIIFIYLQFVSKRK